MVTNEDFFCNLWPQNCGDILKVIEKSDKQTKKGDYFFLCEFQKYPHRVLSTKSNILKGAVLNPQIEQKEFIEKLWPQNCGDILKIIKKSKEKKGNEYLWECEFLNYPYKCLVLKQKILKGAVLNPQIEQKEFIDKLWPQKCGDVLKILEKGEEKSGTNFLYKCIFLKYPFEVKAQKGNILKGEVFNPLIEKEEFIGKSFLQNCGDVLKVLEKTKKKNKVGIVLYRCQFQKYPCEILAVKSKILSGQILNPEFEKFFMQKLWPQSYGDFLKIIQKTNIKNISNEYYFKCKFQKYPFEVLATKQQIVKGIVWNQNLPWKKRELLIDYIQQNFKNKKPTLKEISDSIGISISVIGQAINKFDLNYLIDYSFFEQENKVREYVKTLGFEGKTKYFDKNLFYKELDIYISEYNLGIEYNGNYWHSELWKESNYHQEKSLLFKEKLGIEILHIFEYEWDTKQEILKSIIKAKVGLFDKKIGARQCEIRELDNKIYQQFCDINHFQGQAGAKVKLGLFFQEELVQVMSFGVPRFTDKFKWEIIRECSKLGYFIIGGKQKLWNYFLKNYLPSNCISYCDFSKFNGNSYLKLGFKQERLNIPGFVWWDRKTNQTFWRSPEKHQEMKEKYLKIYDCGQLVFIWKKED